MKGTERDVNINIVYNGRFDFTGYPKFAWSGCSISVKFIGSTASVKLYSFGNDYFLVKIDDKITKNRLHVQGLCDIELCNNLKYGEHSIEIIKRTEYNIGCTEFLGFEFKDGYDIPSEKKNYDLKIEFIGDSISAGYGVDSKEFTTEEVLKVPYNPLYDNSYDTYCAITARKLNAEYHITACSGYGVIRNYNGFPGLCMPGMMEKLTPKSTEKWDFSKWIPDIVVINLGTNDFSVNFIPDKQAFVNTYIEMIDKLRSYYKNAKFICSVGPLVTGEALTVLRDYVTEAVNHFNNDNVCLIEYPFHTWADGYGLQNHPSRKTHEKMADLLIPKIKSLL